MEGKQRYKCRECNKNPTEAKRKEYTKDEKLKMVKAYLNGLGFNAIARVFDVSVSGVTYFIKNLGTKLEELKKKEIREEDVIQLLEADELFTYVKKRTAAKQNKTKSEYGR